MNLDAVRELVNEVIGDKYSLYDVKFYKEYGSDILQILIDKKGGINIDELADLNEAISLKLDAIDGDMPEYLLEVSSPGAEKELRNHEEIKEALEKYIHIDLEDKTYDGYLLDLTDTDLTIKINLKGRIKKLKVNLADIKFIRLAVKL